MRQPGTDHFNAGSSGSGVAVLEGVSEDKGHTDFRSAHQCDFPINPGIVAKDDPKVVYRMKLKQYIKAAAEVTHPCTSGMHVRRTSKPLSEPRTGSGARFHL